MVARLLSRPALRHVAGDRHTTVEYGYLDYNGETYQLYPGFIWDLASRPSLIPDWFMPNGDELTYPSLWHDYFYRRGFVTRAEADTIFRQLAYTEFKQSNSLRLRWTAGARSWAAWAGVHFGGQDIWDSYRGV